MSNLFKLYRKSTDGTPTLFMPDQTTIGSSLNTTDLSTDLATLASKEYVVNEVDKFSRSSLAGKVDTYEDLPELTFISHNYTAPVLTADGTPYVDEYAVSASSVYQGRQAWNASNLNTSMYWHSAARTANYTMYFKGPTVINHILFRNKVYFQFDQPYAISEYYIRAQNRDDGDNWVVLTDTVTNNNNNPSGEWECKIDNIVAYDTYQIVMPSTRGYAAAGSIIPSGNARYVDQTNIKVGTIYLVGTEGDLEEYILTNYGWERMGEIRQSDVDLTEYTSTEGMNGALATYRDNGIEDVDTMRTDIQAYLDTLNTDIEGALLDLPMDTGFIDDVPNAWPEDMSASGLIFTTGFGPVPESHLLSTELTSNGTPYVDPYAVDAIAIDGSQMAYQATNENVLSHWHSPPSPAYPIYYTMYFKDAVVATELEMGNREYATWPNTIRFAIEASNDDTNWVTVREEDSEGSTVPSAIWSVEIANRKPYRAYRVKFIIGSPWSSGNYVVQHLIRLKGYRMD